MKRFNLVLDEELVERVRQITGERTYAGAVMKAMKEMDRIETLRTGMERLHGIGWEGDLNEMRESRFPDWDVPVKRRSANVARTRTKNRRAPR